jgi:hypothetical protein
LQPPFCLFLIAAVGCCFVARGHIIFMGCLEGIRVPFIPWRTFCDDLLIAFGDYPCLMVSPAILMYWWGVFFSSRCLIIPPLMYEVFKTFRFFHFCLTTKIFPGKKKVRQHFCSHIFGLVFFSIFTLYLRCDKARAGYPRVAKPPNCIPTQRNKFFTAKV